MRMRSCFALILAFAALAAFTSCASSAAPQTPLFSFADPKGDDHGDGSLAYPMNPDFASGDLDLVSFEAFAMPGGTTFRATFARNIRVPGGQVIDTLGLQLKDLAKLGFYTMNIDVYIDQDNVAGSGSFTSLPGRRVDMASGHGWEHVVCLTPRPNDAKIEFRRILAKQLRDKAKDKNATVGPDQVAELKKQIPADVDQFVYFPDDVTVSGREIDFYVPNVFLGGPWNPDWSIAVAVSAADLETSLDLQGALTSKTEEERLQILPVLSGRPTFALGGAREDDALQAPLLDILTPPGVSQETILKDYDLSGGRRAQLPFLSTKQ